MSALKDKLIELLRKLEVFNRRLMRYEPPSVVYEEVKKQLENLNVSWWWKECCGCCVHSKTSNLMHY